MKLGTEAIREQQLNSVKADVGRQLSGRYGTSNNDGYIKRVVEGVVYRKGNEEDGGLFDLKWQLNVRLRYDSDLIVVDRVLVEDFGRDTITGDLPDGHGERLLSELRKYGVVPLEERNSTKTVRNYFNRGLAAEDFDEYEAVREGLVRVNPETGQILVEAAPLNGNLLDVSRDVVNIMQQISSYGNQNPTTMNVGEFESGRYGLVLDFRRGLELRSGEYSDPKEVVVNFVSSLVNLTLDGRVSKPHMEANGYGMHREVKGHDLGVERPLLSLEQAKNKVMVEYAAAAELRKRMEAEEAAMVDEALKGVETDTKIVDAVMDEKRKMQQLRISLNFRYVGKGVSV